MQAGNKGRYRCLKSIIASITKATGNILIFTTLIALTFVGCTAFSTSSGQKQKQGGDPVTKATPIGVAKEFSLDEVKQNQFDSLQDHPNFGSEYALCKGGLNILECPVHVNVTEENRLMKTYLLYSAVIFVEIKPTEGTEGPFRFTDNEWQTSNMYPRLEKCHTFRVQKPQKEDGFYAIRGFDENKKCIYYLEWQKPQNEDALDFKKMKTTGDTSALGIPTLPTIKFEVPKMRGGPLFPN